MTSPALYLFGTAALAALVLFTIWLSKPRRMLRLIAFGYAARFVLLLVVIAAGLFFGLTDPRHGP